MPTSWRHVTSCLIITDDERHVKFEWRNTLPPYTFERLDFYYMWPSDYTHCFLFSVAWNQMGWRIIRCSEWWGLHFIWTSNGRCCIKVIGKAAQYIYITYIIHNLLTYKDHIWYIRPFNLQRSYFICWGAFNLRILTESRAGISNYIQ